MIPTIFIGIGTTGAEILQQIQYRIYDEYLVPNFPMIRLLCLATARDDASYVSSLPDPDDVLTLSLPHSTLNTIMDNLTRGVTRRDRVMAEWVPQQVLRSSGYEDGSNRIRAVGRLHLWHHWDVIKRRIQEIVNSFHHEDNVTEANRIIQGIRRGAGEPIAVERGRLNIFVVGTLCGGTCSGMIPEFGHFLKDSYPYASVFAVATVPEAFKAGELEELSRNCYTALQELNLHYYHNHFGGREIPFPDGERRKVRKPYDVFYVVGTANMAGAKFVNNDQVDEHSLNQMVAVRLFLEASSTMHGALAGLRVNYDSAKSPHDELPWGLDAVEGARNPRFLTSFGISAVSVPKYRLARAAACRIADGIVRSLIADRATELVINDRTKKIVDELEKVALSKLEDRPGGGVSIELEIARMCDSEQLYAKEVEELSEEVDRILQKIEINLDSGGDYSLILQNQLETKVSGETKRILMSSYELNRNDANISFGDLKKILITTDAALVKICDDLRKKSADKKIDRVYLDGRIDELKDTDEDGLLWWFILQDRALMEAKDDLLVELGEEALTHFKTVLYGYKIRAYEVARTALDIHIRRITAAIEVLSKIADPDKEMYAGKIAARRYKEIIKTLKEHPRTVKYLYPHRTAEAEISSLVANQPAHCGALLVDSVRALKPESGVQFPLETAIVEHKEQADLLFEKMIANIVSGLLGHIGAVDVAQETLARRDEVLSRHFVEGSAPYVELRDDYWENHRMRIDGDELFCTILSSLEHNSSELRLIKEQMPVIRGKHWNNKKIDVDSQQLVLYCEEPFFSTTFMPSFKAFKNKFDIYIERGAVNTGMEIQQPNRYWSDTSYATHGINIAAFTNIFKWKFYTGETLKFLETAINNSKHSDRNIFVKIHSGIFMVSEEANNKPCIKISRVGAITSATVVVDNDNSIMDISNRDHDGVVLKHVRTAIIEAFSHLSYEIFDDEVLRMMGAIELKEISAENANKEAPKRKHEQLSLFSAFIKTSVFRKKITELGDEESRVYQQNRWIRE